MVDVSIGNKTSPEANWNRQAGRQADRQADGRTGKPVYWEAAPPKILKMFLVRDPSVQSITVLLKIPYTTILIFGNFMKTIYFVQKLNGPSSQAFSRLLNL